MKVRLSASSPQSHKFSVSNRNNRKRTDNLKPELVSVYCNSKSLDHSADIEFWAEEPPHCFYQHLPQETFLWCITHEEYSFQ
jgi:hypothetical protein